MLKEKFRIYLRRCNILYNIDTSVLLENTPVVKFTPTELHPGLEWRIFDVLTSKDIDDFTDIKFVSLNCT